MGRGKDEEFVYIAQQCERIFEGEEYKNETNEFVERQLSSLLFASHMREGVDPDVVLEEIKKQGPRQVCQYQFRKNDIVWICRSCQKDETCVLCNDCFQDSKHEGHEVYFYHSQSGGCCDCGDSGAWNPGGFCTKHGREISDPLTTIPAEVVSTGKLLLAHIVESLTQFCEMTVCNFDISNYEDQPSGTYNVMLYNDDIHTINEVTAALERVAVPPEERTSIANKVHEIGLHAVQTQIDLCTAQTTADILKQSNLHVCIVPIQFEYRVQAVLAVLGWLYKIAQSNDGLCRLICDALTVPQLQRIMESDPYLQKSVVVSLHGLFLTLMADKTFKISVSIAYSLAFTEIATLYGRGIGPNEHSMFGLSVQFLNRDIYVENMVHNYDFLSSVSKSLLDMLQQANGQFNHPVLVHRRYIPLIGDLKVAFTIAGPSRYFCATCLPLWCQMLETYQYAHPQIRQELAHVEYESKDWMTAFNLYLSVGSLFEYIINWLEDPNCIIPATMNNRDLPTPSDLLQSMLQTISAWQQKFFDESDLRTQIYESFPTGNFICYPSMPRRSFHLYLHRFLSTVLRECTKHDYLVDTLAQFLVAIKKLSMLSLVQLMDFAMIDIVWMSEIRSGMWRRNGQVMYDQILNYGEAPFCKIFKDLDLLLTQFLVVGYGASKTLNHLMLRHGLLPLLHHGPTPHDMLLDEFLILLVHLVTETPLPVYAEKAKRVRILVRRECLHKLVGGYCTYSQLQECFTQIPESDKVSSSELDTVINDIAEWIESQSLEPSKLRLRESMWCEYDPLFCHANHKAHQAAMEAKPKLKLAEAIAPPPPPCHPVFAPLRPLLLTDPLTYHLIRDICYITCHQRTKHDKYRFVLSWHNPTTSNTFSYALHLMTLQLHVLLEKPGDDVAALYSKVHDASYPSHTDALQNFCSFLLCQPVILFNDECLTAPCLLDTLIDIYEYHYSAQDDLQHHLMWIISKVMDLNDDCKEKIESKLEAQINEKKKLDMITKRNKAKENMMRKMQAKAAAFAQTIVDAEYDTDEDIEEDAESSECTMDCIVCKESSTNDVLGYLGYTQATLYLRHQTQGTIHVGADPNVLPPPNTKRDLHYQFCGHLMHVSCFETYFAGAIMRSESQNGLILDTDRGQYQCPLCKKLSNFLLPIVQPPKHRKRARSELEPTDLMSWMSMLPSESADVDDSLLRRDIPESRIRSNSLSEVITGIFSRISHGSDDRGSAAETDFSGLGDDQRDKSMRMLLRFMSNFCEPLLGSLRLDQFRLNFQNIPQYVATMLASMSATMLIQVLDKAPPRESSHMDPYRHTSQLAALFVEFLSVFNLQKKMTQLCINSFLGIELTPWSQYIKKPLHIGWNNSELHFTDEWFMLPLLHKPLLDFSLLSLMLMEDRSFVAGWCAVAYALQWLLLRLLEEEADFEKYITEFASIHDFKSYPSTTLLHSIGTIIVPALQQYHPAMQRRISLLLGSNLALLEFYTLWMHFQRVILHFLRHVTPEVITTEVTERELTHDCILSVSSVFGLDRFFDAAAIAELRDPVLNLIRPILTPTGVDRRPLLNAVGHIPCLNRPQFIDIPDSYTKLHAMLMSSCQWDYPALCMVCGEILDSAGKGRCTAHVAECGGEAGVFFLLQECNMLLLHSIRGCYYPSPFVDSYGEKHRHFRGKPLFVDHKRFDILKKLWHHQNIPREVAQKRSSSSRVIINGHY